MKQVYIKPLAEIVPVQVKTAILEMSGEVEWGMGNQQNIFDEEDSSLPKPANLWGEGDNQDDKSWIVPITLSRLAVIQQTF